MDKYLHVYFGRCAASRGVCYTPLPVRRRCPTGSLDGRCLLAAQHGRLYIAPAANAAALRPANAGILHWLAQHYSLDITATS